MGFQAGLNAFTAAVVGGIGNLPGRRARRPRSSGSPSRSRSATSRRRSGRDRLRDPDRRSCSSGRAGCSGARRCRRSDATATTPIPQPDERSRGSASTSGSRRTRGGASAATASRPRPAAFERVAAPAFYPRVRRRRGARCRSSRATATCIRVGFDTLLYMLLALGLNIVVGFAGLLDLGYVAFYGFGAYVYAMLASPTSSASTGRRRVDPDRRRAGDDPARAARRRCRRGACVGDYLAIVTLFFGQLFVTRRPATGTGSRSSASTRGYDITGGPNGITERRPLPPLRASRSSSLRSYYYVALARSSLVVCRASTSSATRAPGAPGARCARTRSPPS